MSDIVAVDGVTLMWDVRFKAVIQGHFRRRWKKRTC